MPLNKDQLAAAQASDKQPLKIIAGAGAGKTETLAARYVALVAQGVPPERIVLLTFTEDAAAEMRARVILRLQESGIALPPHALIQLWISTFHGFATRLLRDYGYAAGLPPAPRLADDDEQAELWSELRAAVENEQAGPDGYQPLDHDTYPWETDEVWSRVLGVVEDLRRGGGSPAELEPAPELRDQQLASFSAHRAQLVPLIEHCFARYTAVLHGRGILDYDEQLQAALRLLRAVPALRQRFDVLMVDEFQDTNRAQLELLAALQPGHARTTVVGDPRQAIYGWNSARAESIEEFPFRATETPLKPALLLENYRSHPAIVRVANLALSGSELAKWDPLTPALGLDEHLLLPDEPVVTLQLLPDVAAEASFIAAEIGRLHAAGVPFSDMAVLMRARTKQPELLAALRAAGVPYVLKGGTGFFLHPFVRLTASLLRLLADPHDHAAWAHLLESPLLALPPELIAARDDAADRDAPRPFTRWLDDPETLPPHAERDEHLARLNHFRAWFGRARERWGLVPPGDFLDWLWRESQLPESTGADGETALVMRQLLRDADDYASAHPAESIGGFATVLRQRVQTQPRVPLPTPPVVDAVELATVHQAKGREWPVVFVYNTALPSRRAAQVEHVLWDERWKLVISEGEGGKNTRDDPLSLLREDFRRRNRNEERSIWYVALTRARQRLFVLHSGCALEDRSFADALGKWQRRAAGAAPAKQDDAVHFFHELWQQLHTAPSDPAIHCAAELAPTEIGNE